MTGGSPGAKKARLLQVDLHVLRQGEVEERATPVAEGRGQSGSRNAGVARETRGRRGGSGRQMTGPTRLLSGASLDKNC